MSANEVDDVADVPAWRAGVADGGTAGAFRAATVEECERESDAEGTRNA